MRGCQGAEEQKTMAWDEEEMKRSDIRRLVGLGMKESWYQLCQDRKQWLARCREGVDEVASCKRTLVLPRDRPYVYECRRTQGDLTRQSGLSS